MRQQALPAVGHDSGKTSLHSAFQKQGARVICMQENMGIFRVSLKLDKNKHPYWPSSHIFTNYRSEICSLQSMSSLFKHVKVLQKKFPEPGKFTIQGQTGIRTPFLFQFLLCSRERLEVLHGADKNNRSTRPSEAGRSLPTSHRSGSAPCTARSIVKKPVEERKHALKNLLPKFTTNGGGTWRQRTPEIACSSTERFYKYTHLNEQFKLVLCVRERKIWICMHQQTKSVCLFVS